MKRTASLCVVVAVVGLLLGACGGGGGGGSNPPVTTYLTVSGNSPAQGATGLLTNTAVSVTFSETLDCATVSSATYTIHSGPTGTGAGVAGTLGCTASTITFSPTGTGLSYSTVYLAQVTTGVKSGTGHALASEVAWSFTVKPPTVSVAAGYSHQIALAWDGGNSRFAYAWGTGTAELGRPWTLADVTIPMLLNIANPSMAGIGETQSHVVTMDLTNHINRVYGWGDNVFGDVGNGTKTPVSSPTVITFPTLSTGLTPTIVNTAGSPVHTLALDQDGRVWAWGNNCVGQLGDGTTAERLTPGLVSFPTPTPRIIDIDASIDSSASCEYFSMALDDTGRVWVWGSNAHGQLAQLTEGDGGIASSPTPTLVSQLTGTAIVSISAGWRYAVAADDTGTVYAWGDNNTGTLGDGTCTALNYSADPVPVKGPGGSGLLTGIDQLSASKNGAFTLGIDASGNIWGWGDNSAGQLGDGTTGVTEMCGGSQTLMNIRLFPVQATGLTGVSQVKAGLFHSLAVKNDGTVWAWGDNTDGLLGKGVSSTTTVLTPTQVPGM